MATTPGPYRRPPVGDILRLLFGEAEKRIASTERPNFDLPKRMLTPSERERFQQWRRARRAQRQLTHWFKRRNWTLHDYNGTISDAGGARAKRQAAWDFRQLQRQALLKALRLNAAMDLLGMSPQRAKGYLKNLQKKLAKL